MFLPQECIGLISIHLYSSKSLANSSNITTESKTCNLLYVYDNPSLLSVHSNDNNICLCKPGELEDLHSGGHKDPLVNIIRLSKGDQYNTYDPLFVEYPKTVFTPKVDINPMVLYKKYYVDLSILCFR